MVYLVFLVLFLVVYVLSFGLVVSFFDLGSQLSFLHIPQNMTATDIAIKQLSVWLTWLVVGILATVCALIYLENREKNSTKMDSVYDFSNATISDLSTQLNDSLDRLSELEYEVGSDFDVSYDEALDSLSLFLDVDGYLDGAIALDDLRELVKQFEEIEMYEREV